MHAGTKSAAGRGLRTGAAGNTASGLGVANGPMRIYPRTAAMREMGDAFQLEGNPPSAATLLSLRRLTHHSPSSTRPRVTSPMMVVRLITRFTPGGVPVAQCMMRQLSQRTMSPSCHWWK